MISCRARLRHHSFLPLVIILSLVIPILNGRIKIVSRLTWICSCWTKRSSKNTSKAITMMRISLKSRTRRRSSYWLWQLPDKALILQLEEWSRILEQEMTVVSTHHKVTANKTNNPNFKLIQKDLIWWSSRVEIINSKKLIRQAHYHNHRSSRQDPKNTKSKLDKNTPTLTATQAYQDQWTAPTITPVLPIVSAIKTQKLI